jgi:hypothetical protein
MQSAAPDCNALNKTRVGVVSCNSLASADVALPPRWSVDAPEAGGRRAVAGPVIAADGVTLSGGIRLS